MTQRILDYGWAIGPHDATSGLLLQFSVTASRRWRVSAPGTSTGAHHHADTETAAYVLSGTVRIYFGNDFEEYLDASAGEFVFVPPRIPHIEINLSHEGGDVRGCPFVGRANDHPNRSGPIESGASAGGTSAGGRHHTIAVVRKHTPQSAQEQWDILAECVLVEAALNHRDDLNGERHTFIVGRETGVLEWRPGRANVTVCSH